MPAPDLVIYLQAPVDVLLDRVANRGVEYEVVMSREVEDQSGGELDERGDASDGADVVCLSALMTTTLPSMEATIQRLKKEGLDIPVVVGGAVVTEEYARRIGAAGYAADGLEGVRVIGRLLE